NSVGWDSDAEIIHRFAASFFRKGSEFVPVGIAARGPSKERFRSLFMKSQNVQLVQSRQSMRAPFRPVSRSAFYLLLGAAIIKLSVLLVSGPSFFPDSPKYIAYADAILDHGRAFAPVVWGAEAIPPYIFRFPGYPLFLAGAKLISPVHYAF